MKKVITFLALFLLAGTCTYAQVSINTDNSIPDPSAMLDVKSTTKGMFVPRMTRAERNAIVNPGDGLMVYCTNCGTNGSLSIFTAGSWFTFAPCFVSQPVEGVHQMAPNQVTWKWLAVPGASGYRWNTTPDYETAIDMGPGLSKVETGTNCNVTYSRYVWAYSACGESAAAALSQHISPVAPGATTAGTHIASPIAIVWNWNSVPNATGYRWNTVDDFETAIDMGISVAKSETGLTCGTGYTRFVWAYNGCGVSSSLVLTQSTIACWVCTNTLTVNHVASGGVAPVDKTVTYGTVTNIPGEATKCWISRNLGANQQATASGDATELSAGWYWQFNNKQGYKHDGTVRTPNSAWIVSFSENSDWVTANDPCNSELGSGWRMPTGSEWTNVDASGGWTSATGAYNSGLKLHLGGYLMHNTGLLTNRGSVSGYWSGTQWSVSVGTYLYLNTTYSGMIDDVKSFGFSVRCIRNP
jgi:hypothetical protein